MQATPALANPATGYKQVSAGSYNSLQYGMTTYGDQETAMVGRGRTAGLYVITALAIFVFSGSLLWSLQQLSDTRAVLYGSRATGSWLAFNAELEYRQFMNILARYGLGDRDITRQQLIDRFDIMWSRIPLLVDSPDADRLAKTDVVPRLVSDMIGTLEELEPLVVSLEYGDRAGYRRIRDAMAAFGPRLRDILITSEIDLKQEFRQHAIETAYRQVFLSFIGVLLAGGVLIMVLLLQLRRVARISENYRRASAEADAANRAKSDFLARMTHELRTPLTAVIGYSELLHEEAEESGNTGMLEDLDRIGFAGQHLLAMINDTLDLAKIETGRSSLHTEAVDIRQLALDVLDTVQPLVKKNRNRLENSLAETGLILADATKLRQILFNLLSNAAKFTADGVIGLDLQRHTDQQGGWIVLRVSDTGIGVPEEDRERIFRPFVQADDSSTRRHSGTGLGLAVARSFCELMGGTLEMTSKAGEGSVFTARLPAVDVKAASAGAAGADITAPARFSATGE